MVGGLQGVKRATGRRRGGGRQLVMWEAGRRGDELREAGRAASRRSGEATYTDSSYGERLRAAGGEQLRGVGEVLSQTNHTRALRSGGMSNDRLLIPLLGATNPYPKNHSKMSYSTLFLILKCG